MIALIDGDIAAYRAAVSTQRSLDWDDGDGPSVYANPTEAAKAAIETIRLWVDMAGCTKAMVALTGSGNFRKLIYPAYKSNRSGVERPVALYAVREAIAAAFPTVMVNGLEADDLLGMALTMPKNRGRAVCVTVDKDLRGVPGLHLNPIKEAHPTMVMEAEANRWWFTQALTGDASDGYPGCPGIGPKKAARYLDNWDGVSLGAAYDVLVDLFGFAALKAGLDPSETPLSIGEAPALTSLRVSRILRAGDYDKRTREVLLWHPTTPERLLLPT